MLYFQFLLKRLLKSRWFMIAVAFCLLLITGIFGQYQLTAKRLGYDHIERLTPIQYEYVLKNELAQMDETDAYYEIVKAQINDNTDNWK